MDEHSAAAMDDAGDDLLQVLSRKVVGQPAAMRFLVPYIRMYRAGLSPADRPAGIFMLLGPTGTGKTRTVEALAETLHGNPRNLLKIDCGEYQSDHEVAKLIGAPPGYLGHRETKPLLTPERLLAATSPGCDLALVLFDEIEKAAPALTTLLLGILDRAVLRLGDNTQVGFEKTLIFLTSNLGAREMLREVQPGIGFQGGLPASSDVAGRLESIGLAAVRKRFSPEFVNRIDVIVTYQPLDAEALAAIVDHHIDELQRHVHTRLGDRSFTIDVTPEARRLLVEKGTSAQYGARELKRTIHRMLTQPLAELVADKQVAPGARVVVDRDAAEEALEIRPEAPAVEPSTAGAFETPSILVLDDNPHLREWLRRGLQAVGTDPIVAETLTLGRTLVAERQFDAALVDVVLPDGEGLTLAVELARSSPRTQVIVMSGMELAPDELALCERYGFPVLRKPFLLDDVVNVLRATLVTRVRAAGQGG
jgi:MoxR-like ATPase/ActR/RegA family two-component response regulator